MDLTDILFSKPFIGNSGEGGGSSNVETATIEITVTDSTPTITSGEFPDWCTTANSDYIYGRAYWNDIETVFLGVFSMEGTQIVTFIESGFQYGVATDLSLIVIGEDEPTPLTGDCIIKITLIYMPEE